LLVANVLCFGAQLLSKNSLVVWGAKVRLQQAPESPAEMSRAAASEPGSL